MARLYTKRTQSLIINNISRCILSDNLANITFLSYTFLAHCAGFVVNVRFSKFKDTYTANQLRTLLIINKELNQWKDLTPMGFMYNQCMIQKHIYNSILEKVGEIIQEELFINEEIE